MDDEAEKSTKESLKVLEKIVKELSSGSFRIVRASTRLYDLHGDHRPQA